MSAPQLPHALAIEPPRGEIGGKRFDVATGPF